MSILERVRNRMRTLVSGGGAASGAALMAVSSVVGQGVSFLAYPALTRLYSPEAFGYLGVFLSVVTTCMVFAALRFEYAIPIPRSGRLATATAYIAVALAVVSTVFVGMAVGIVAWAAPGWLDQLSGGDWRVAVLVPLGVFTVTAFNVLYYWAIRQRAFRDIAVTRVTQSFTTVAVQLGVGLLAPSAIGLVVGYLAGRFAGAVRMVRLFLRSRAPLGTSPAGGKALRVAALKYRDFPLLAVSSSLLEAASFALIQVAITASFGAAISGYYLLSQQTIYSPIGLIFGSIAGAFYGRAGQGEDPQVVARLNARILLYAILMFCGPVSVLFPCFPALFRVVYGEEWAEAGVYAQLLLPALLTHSLVTLTMLYASRMQWLKDDFRFNLTFFFIRLGVLAIGIAADSPLLTMGLLGFVGASLNLVYSGWFTRRSGVLSGRLLRGLGVYAIALAAANLLAYVWANDAFDRSPFAGAIVLITLFSAMLGFGELMRRRLVQELSPTLRSA